MAKIVKKASMSNDNGGCVGPYAAMAQELFGDKSIDRVDLQFKYLRMVFSPSSHVIFGARERVGELDSLIYEAAELATVLFADLVKDSQTSIEAIRVPNRALKYRATGGKAMDWNPSVLTYRAFSIPHGDLVSTFAREFLDDFVGVDECNDIVRKPNPLKDHPYVKELVEKLLQRGDEHNGCRNLKRKAVFEGKQHRHPCMGTIPIHQYRLYEGTIERALQGDDAACLELAAALPESTLNQVKLQHEFERSFVRLCDMVNRALFAYVDGDGDVFGDNHVARHATFALTVTQNFDSIEGVEKKNRPATWYLRILNQLLCFNEPQLRERYYVPQCKFKQLGNDRRHPSTRSVDHMYREVGAQASAWLQSEFVKLLGNFYVHRAVAYSNGQKVDREAVRKTLGIYRNVPDSFKYICVTYSRCERHVRREDAADASSYDMPSSVAEEHCLWEDATILATLTLGEKEASLAFPELFNAVSEGTEPRFDRQAPSVRFQNSIDLLGGWLPRDTRSSKVKVLECIDENIKLVSNSIADAKNAVNLTKKVVEEYKLQRSKWDEQTAHINSLSVNTVLTVDQTTHITLNEAQVVHAVLEASIKAVSQRCLFIVPSPHIIKDIVGFPPNWNWTAKPENLAHVEILKSYLVNLQKYRAYIGESTATTGLVDFAAMVTPFIKAFTTARTAKRGKEDGDDVWVGLKSFEQHRMKQTVEWFKRRVDSTINQPAQFVDKVLEIVQAGFATALCWAGVFSSVSISLVRIMPRRALGIDYVLRVLSTAYVFGALDALFVIDRARRRIELADEPQIRTFIAESDHNWRCFCAIAELTKKLLVYNRCIAFDHTQWDTPEAVAAANQNYAVCFEDSDEFLVFADDSHVMAHAGDLVRGYPPSSRFSFSDDHFSTPLAFATLLTWLPTVATEPSGFFPLSGIRDRSKLNNGFADAKVRIDNIQPDRTTQHWATFYASPLARAHGRLPTPPL